MDISTLLVDFLKQKEKVSVSGFGDFVIENVAAVFNEADKTLLPPSKKIVYLQNYDLQNYDFVHFVAQKNDISKENALQEIKKQTDFWKNKIEKAENFSIENLGEFKITADSVKFEGNSRNTQESDFYGLEKIVLENLNKKFPKTDEKRAEITKNEYHFNNSILWLFLFIIPILGLLYLGITQQEGVFGKKSFQELSQKNATHRIEKKPIKQDSAKINAPKDSLKNDSLNKVMLVSTKKWSNIKKYKKPKWRKVKKRTNH